MSDPAQDDRDIVAAVDRLVVDAADVVAADAAYAEGSAPGPAHDSALELAVKDRAVVDAAWRQVAGRPEAADRLAAWARGCRREFPDPSPARLLDQLDAALDEAGGTRDPLWLLAAALVAAESVDYIGLSPVLSAVSPSGEDAWRAPPLAARPLRFAITSDYYAPTLCLWSASDPDRVRWDSYVGPEELPLPRSTTNAYAALSARYAELTDEGYFPAEHTAERIEIWDRVADLVGQWQPLLGPAYAVRVGSRSGRG